MKTLLPHCFALLALVLLGGSTARADETTSPSSVQAETMSVEAKARRPDIAFGVDRYNWRIHTGDDVRWARPDWDDQTWQPIGSMFDTPAHQGIFWLRFRVHAPNPADRVPNGAWISGRIAYELYWDGVLMVRNGVPANRYEDEVPGRLDVIPTFPESLTGPGEHVVAMRISSYRCGATDNKSGFVFFMNDPRVVQSWQMRNALLPTLAAGAMFILTIVCGLIWFFAARRTALLCVALMSLCATITQALLSLRWFYNYPADWAHPLETAQSYIHGLMAWWFVAFVVTHFAVPYRRWILTGLVPLLGSVYWIQYRPGDLKIASVIVVAYTTAIGPLLWAARHRRPGAWLVTLGVATSAIWILINPWLYTWTGFFPRFLPALLGVTTAIALQIRVERREAQQMRLTAARLEIELLKKSLQPHFLMNTLTALMEVIEQSPADAVKLIDDLAGVFRLLAAMSAEKTVTLEREIELCRAHLRVMSKRSGRDCQLEVAPYDSTARIPPALFLTLIENSFSHQHPVNSPVIFQLRSATLEKGGVRHTFHSPGEIQHNQTRPPGGTGLRYIKARLEESTPGRWSFAHHSCTTGWETVIEIGPPVSIPLP